MADNIKKEMIYDPPPDSKLLGVMRAIGGISDAVSIVHGRSCCHADTLLFRALTSPHDDIRVLGSGLRGQDVSAGGNRKLSLAIRSAYQEFKPELIAVLIASVPTMMGDDVEGTVARMQKEIPARILTFACAGYEGRAGEGYEEVLGRLVSDMVPAEPKGNKVNLLGFKADEPAGACDLKEIKRMLADQGIETNSILTGADFNNILHAPEAVLNIILGGDGLECARLMGERFGLPYVDVPYPFGLEQSVEFLQKVTKAMEREMNQEIIVREKEWIKERLQKVYAYLQGIYGLPVAVVGESGRAFALARFLSDELGLEIKLLSITSQGNVRRVACDVKGETPNLGYEHASPEKDFENVLIAPDHFRMEEAIKARGVEIIFGSTLEKRLAKELGIPLIRISYPVLDAVSIADFPYAGFRGIIGLTEKIINAVIGGACT